MNMESKLISVLKTGDRNRIEKIFEEIYEKYYKLLYFCVGSYITQKEDIEDIVMDTFLSFFNNLDSIDLDGNIKNYLVRSAKNKAINLQKKKREVLIENIEEYSLDFDNDSNGNDLMDIIRDSLNDDERELFLSHVIEDISLRKLSKMRDENINTTKSKYHRIRKKLYEILEGRQWKNY